MIRKKIRNGKEYETTRKKRKRKRENERLRKESEEKCFGGLKEEDIEVSKDVLNENKQEDSSEQLWQVSPAGEREQMWKKSINNPRTFRTYQPFTKYHT